MKNIVSIAVTFDDGSTESFLSHADLTAAISAPQTVEVAVPVVEKDLPKSPTEEPSSDSSGSPAEELTINADNHDAPAEDNVLGTGEASAPAGDPLPEPTEGSEGTDGEAITLSDTVGTGDTTTISTSESTNV